MLEIAEEILSKNRVLNIELLYNVAKRRLKIPRQGLLRIIQVHLNKRVLFEGSKFTKDTLLSNSHREIIYDFIKTNLGAHFSLIRKNIFTDERSKIGGTGQLIWHLEMLLKFNYIKKVKVQKYTVFIPFELDEDLGILNFLLRESINRKIVKLLIEQDAIEKSEIHKHLNEKRESVYYHVKKLIENDIIRYLDEKNKDLLVNPDKRKRITEILKTPSYLNYKNKKQLNHIEIKQ